MAYYITEDCISCAACEPECPNRQLGKEGPHSSSIQTNVQNVSVPTSHHAVPQSVLLTPAILILSIRKRKNNF